MSRPRARRRREGGEPRHPGESACEAGHSMRAHSASLKAQGRPRTEPSRSGRSVATGLAEGEQPCRARSDRRVDGRNAGGSKATPWRRAPRRLGTVPAPAGPANRQPERACARRQGRQRGGRGWPASPSAALEERGDHDQLAGGPGPIRRRGPQCHLWPRRSPRPDSSRKDRPPLADTGTVGFRQPPPLSTPRP